MSSDTLDLSGLTTTSVTIDLNATTWFTSSSGTLLAVTGMETVAWRRGRRRHLWRRRANSLDGGGGNDLILDGSNIDSATPESSPTTWTEAPAGTSWT